MIGIALCRILSWTAPCSAMGQVVEGSTVHGRQDKARFLAAGTSLLSFCLHIVFAGLALGAVGALRILSSLFSTVQTASFVMYGEAETAPLTPMQARLRCSTTGSFLSCRTRFDFRSSSHGTR